MQLGKKTTFSALVVPSVSKQKKLQLSLKDIQMHVDIAKFTCHNVPWHIFAGCGTVKDRIFPFLLKLADSFFKLQVETIVQRLSDGLLAEMGYRLDMDFL